MNILFFLKPKVRLHLSMTTVRSDRYWRQWNFINMLPFPCSIKQGEYVGTMTEGDLLWGIKKYTHLNVKEAETIFIQNFRERLITGRVSRCGHGRSDSKAMNQNFVPVVDDQKKFIGIITRKSIIGYCYEKN